MIDWNQTFKAEYDYARVWLKSEQHYAEPWRPLIRQLSQLMLDDGFDVGHASCLADLHKKSRQGEKTLLGHNEDGVSSGIRTRARH